MPNPPAATTPRTCTGVFDALKRRYLKTLTFGVSADCEGSVLLEVRLRAKQGVGGRVCAPDLLVRDGCVQRHHPAMLPSTPLPPTPLPAPQEYEYSFVYGEGGEISLPVMALSHTNASGRSAAGRLDIEPVRWHGAGMGWGLREADVGFARHSLCCLTGTVPRPQQQYGAPCKQNATVESVKFQIKRLIRCLVEICQTLDRLPPEVGVCVARCLYVSCACCAYCARRCCWPTARRHLHLVNLDLIINGVEVLTYSSRTDLPCASSPHLNPTRTCAALPVHAPGLRRQCTRGIRTALLQAL